jgi:aspartate/glutamate racemase
MDMGDRYMTELLEEAMTRVQQLPPAEQDAIAQLILDELADEEQWDAAFARSQDTLSRLAAKVRADICAGKTTSMGMDEL